jgi:hypothetical protein
LDDYAHYLFHNEEYDALKKLKSMIDFCFSFWSFDSIDTRYTYLINNLRTTYNNELTKPITTFPSDVSFISWNYDVQLEITLCRNFKVNSLEFASSVINTNASVYSDAVDKSKGSLIKLNGSCGHYFNNYNLNAADYSKDHIAFQKNDPALIGFVHKLCVNHHKLSSVDAPESEIRFYFENNRLLKQKINPYIINLLQYTRELIIIGYSFPVVNAKMDKFLISNMPKLERITIVDTAKKIQVIKKIFSSYCSLTSNPELYHRSTPVLNEACFELITDTNSFPLPKHI